jgi:hypothetical protein
MIFGEQYRSLSSSLCSFLHSYVTSSLLDPNILLRTLFSNTPSLGFTPSVSDQLSHPYKATGKISVIIIVVIKLLLLFKGHPCTGTEALYRPYGL